MRVPSSFGRPAAKAALRSQIRFNKAFIPVLEPLERRALLSAGGHLGTVFTDFDDQLDKGGFVVQSENETLIQVGTTISPACGDKPGFALAQFDAEGILDPNFDSDGLATVCLPDDPAFDDYAIWEVNAVALDSMGRIIIVGTANNEPAGDLDYLVARFNSDGTLDDTFGTLGVVITDQTPPLSPRHITTKGVRSRWMVTRSSSPAASPPTTRKSSASCDMTRTAPSTPASTVDRSPRMPL
ncbi:MAG TPA: delta-60 repeat domain-containing protein [Tepidisphaeraceae bacterium]|nr:delta-60 repeat domain-containing protein [Tepidisphaeraceae bacterium]